MGFTIWTCAWFITVEVCVLLDAKTRATHGIPAATPEERGQWGIVGLGIWIVGLVIVI